MKKATKIRESGFDSTEFKSVKAFRAVLKTNKLHYSGLKKNKYGHAAYQWKGKGLEMHTSNNPITGKYNYPKQREPEKGYAGYIGIKGQPKQVAKLVKTVKGKTTFIKGYNSKMNEFIW